VTFWYLPPSQASQLVFPWVAVYEPFAHGVCSVEPVGHEEPSGHGVHSDAELSREAFDQVPEGHGYAAGAPLRQKLPQVQLLHAVAPVSF
jgi:hypothetical protein